MLNEWHIFGGSRIRGSDSVREGDSLKMNKSKQRRRTPGFLATLAIASMLIVSLIPSPVFAQYSTDPVFQGALINGDFEDNTYTLNPAGTYYTNTHDHVSGWLTTETDNQIELWSNGFHPGTGVNANNFGDIAFYSANGSGNYFAEINAGQAGAALYQDIHTIPGSLYEWTFDHRGRNGTDAAQMLLGDPVAHIDPTGLLFPTSSYAQKPASKYYQGVATNLDVGRPSPPNPNQNSIAQSAAPLAPWSYSSMTEDYLKNVATYAASLIWAPAPGANFDGIVAPDPSKDPTVLVAVRGVTGQPNPDTNWTQHKGFYTVPDGQERTRLEMYAEYSTYAVHNPSSAGYTGTAVGNLIDNVHFFPVAAPTKQVVYQGDPNPIDETMSDGYALNSDDTPVLTNGMPTLLSPHETTPGFLYVPRFDEGINISASGNAGENYGHNGDPYNTVASGGVTTVTASTGLYNVPVDVYTIDPNISNDPDNLATNYSDSSGQIWALVGEVTSQILVLPKYTVSGTVAGMPNNSQGVTISYSYTYPLIDPATGELTGDTGTGSGTATTDANGYYSFMVPADATLINDTAPKVGSGTQPSYSSDGNIVPTTINADQENLNFNALNVQYVDANGNPLKAMTNLGLYKSVDPYNVPLPGTLTINGKQYKYQGLYEEGLPSGSDPASGETMSKPMTVIMVFELVASNTKASTSSGSSGGSVVINSSSPQTGDTFSLGMWMFGLIGSAAIVILLALFWLVRRQRRVGKHAAKSYSQRG